MCIYIYEFVVVLYKFKLIRITLVLTRHMKHTQVHPEALKVKKKGNALFNLHMKPTSDTHGSD